MHAIGGKKPYVEHVSRSGVLFDYGSSLLGSRSERLRFGQGLAPLRDPDTYETDVQNSNESRLAAFQP